MQRDFSNLRRPLQPMPGYIAEALQREGLIEQYEARPAYQQNDYLSWITRAVREETREKRLRQMLEELKKGGVYMRMAWKGQ
ncbi:YdeI/OmpD-associated family protein [Chitinophaga sp.]|uniref:YdeI/OmpD-associated family protein n=1 Tax=Chitinophaga sp. TaxID=1869181 RepID=UPI0026394C60|nr:YdeI/OmpD-associated family protein [uncultured Chitinophaga sp.]